MAENIKKKIDSFAVWNSIWLKKQVEGHLVFGLIYKYVPLIFLGGIASVLFAFWIIFDLKNNESLFPAIHDIFLFVIMGVVCIYMSFQLSRYQQAIIGWFSIKGALGVAAFIVMIVGTLTSLSKHQADTLPNFLLGFIWLPWIEFIPAVVPYQKLVTLSRLILTIPVVYLGIQSGCWTW